MTCYVKPHTREWFKALERTDPRQAAMTREALKRAGREDGCSICGDDPAADYQKVNPRPASGAVATLRLCDECRVIRQAAQGEVYLPF